MTADRKRRIALAALLALAPGGTLAAQAPERGSFLLRRGSDTLAVETFTRAAGRLEAELATRVPGLRQRLAAEIAPDALIPRLQTTVLPGISGEAAPVARATAVFRGDSALVEVQAAGATAPQRFAPGRGALPYVNLSGSILEQMVRRARVVGGEQVRIPMFNLQGGNTFAATVTRRGADSTVVSIGGVELRLATDAAGRVLGGTVPSQSVVIERSAAEVRFSAAPPPDYSAPAGAPYRAEEVRVRTPSGVTLAGTLTLPTGVRGRVPAVLLLSGSGPQDRDEALTGITGYRPFRQVADTLGRRGIAVLRLDDRGVGGSGGDPGATSLAEFAEDARAALAYLRGRPEVDPRRTAIVGHSEGALVGPMAAAGDSALRALALLAGPARTGRALVEYQQRYALESDTTIAPSRYDSLLAAARVQVDSLAANSRWLLSLLAHDPLPVARRLRLPVLILQGATDRQVPAEEAAALEAAVRAGGSRDVTVRVFPDLNHLFLRDPRGNVPGYAALPSKQVAPEVLGALADWLAAKLR